jgi:hypothetical protein
MWGISFPKISKILGISMPRKHRAISTFLIVGISFIFILAYANFNYNILIEADFITHGKKFEAADLDNLWADKQINLDFMPGESLIISSPVINLPGLLIWTSFQVVSANSLFSVLRC